MPFLTNLKSRLPKKRWKRAFLYAASTFFILLAADMSLTAYWRRITVSRETTFLTSPLNSDGTPDYLTWLNQKASQGVTPENNAAIPLLRASGLASSADTNPQWQDAVASALGLPGEKLPQKFTRYTRWAAAQGIAGAKTTPSSKAEDDAIKALLDQEDHMFHKLWNDTDLPNGARWLESQKEALALVHQAASRSQCYIPALPLNPKNRAGDAITAQLPYLANIRYLGRMLNADTLRHARDSDKSIFIRSTIDSLKIASLLSHQNVLIQNLVGLTMQRESYEAVLTSLDQLTPADARSLIAAIDTVPPPAELDLTGERCAILDICCFQASAGFGHSPFGPHFQPKAAPVLSLIVPVHFNSVMAETNTLFDRIAEEQRIPSVKQRTQALAATQRQLNSGTRAMMSGFAGATQVIGPDDLWMSRTVLNRQEVLTRRDLTRLALALALYHADKGNYPATLSALTGPDGILPSIPLDAFSDQPLLYRLDNRGYVLYSVGKDFLDDHADPEKDLVVRMEH